MIKTDFRPSIHGWPFDNNYSFHVDLPFGDATFRNLGYCGGMCWTAQRRYYSATRIPRDTPDPAQGDALYNEILAEQVSSLPPTKVMKIYDWQQSPDMSSWSDFHHSLGHKSKQEWPSIRQHIDDGKPVTITLIAHSNDYDPRDLSDNHRVIAYGYDERPLRDGDWVHGGRHAGIRKITIWIYDPNFHDDDDVQLSFFTGCDDNWIGLRHNQPGEEFHGFFRDDPSRSYTFADSTTLAINSCTQSSIVSFSTAEYDLRFSWRCRVIPCFCIQVDGVNWNFNDAAKASYEPTGLDNKQCMARTGSETIRLRLPRTTTTVTVRLLDSDSFVQSVDVDARPRLECLPYVRSRCTGGGPGVCDTSIGDADLFIKVEQPTEAEIAQLDTSPFRWVIDQAGRVVDHRARSDDLTRAIVAAIRTTKLGNIVAPVHANFIVANMAPPFTLSGTVRITRGGMPQTTGLPTMATSGQLIFDGFTDNPADYDNDTEVRFNYQCHDAFGASASGQVFFYGKSIIDSETQITLQVFDPSKLAKLEAVARKLLELGLIDIAIGLHHGGHGPIPPLPVDPEKLARKVVKNRELQHLVDHRLRALWSDKDTWKGIWDVQSRILKLDATERPPSTEIAAKPGARLRAGERHRLQEQQKFDSVILDTIVQKALEEFRKDSGLMDKLKEL